MRQRRTFITLTLILGALVLSIAYAAITGQTLNVVGNILTETSDANFSIAFSGSPVINKPTLADGSEMTDVIVDASYIGKNAILNVSGLNAKGQTVTAIYTVKNSSADIEAILSDVDVQYDNTAWFDVDAVLSSQLLSAKGGTATLTITITLKDTPATDAEVAAATDDFTVSFTADAK